MHLVVQFPCPRGRTVQGSFGAIKGDSSRMSVNAGIVASSELRSCVKVEVAVPNKPTVSVDVKQHSANQQRLH